MVNSLVRGLLVTLALTETLHAQCATWAEGFLPTGMDNPVRAMRVFDDDSGSALYVAGAFTSAGGTSASFVAKWNGTRWSALGGGMNAPVDALEVFDDGTGPALFAGGSFTVAGGAAAHHIAKWNGGSWSTLGTGMGSQVRAMCVFDDGSGPALIATGHFVTAGGLNIDRIAKWNGTSWSALGSGLNEQGYALATFDDGTGPALYVGGTFTAAGGAVANHIARWNGISWSALGNGMDGVVYELRAYDDGSGDALYAGGSFSNAGASAADNIAKWNAGAWSSVGNGMSGPVRALGIFDDGTGRALYAGGYFTTAGGSSANYIARWNGTGWSPRGGGTSGQVNALEVFDDGAGPSLYAGGDFTAAGNRLANHIARWHGGDWSAVSSGDGMNGTVYALQMFDDGTGPALYAGGNFTAAGSTSASGIARWNGGIWSPLGGGTDGAVIALRAFDDGSGPALYAAGGFTSAGDTDALRIARWNGASWSALGGGMSNNVKALEVFDDGAGPALYAGGDFITAGVATANRVAKWDGTRWLPLGSGLGGSNPSVSALAVFDDGSGPALYAGGTFTSADGASASYIARWNGTSWSALASGMSGSSPYVYALHVHDDGSGPALYAGGGFTTAGGTSANRIARWDGTSWSALASGLGGFAGSYPFVSALTTFDDGSGPVLYAGGGFTTAGGANANRLAKWNGISWSPVSAGNGVSGTVYALQSFDDGLDADRDLFVAGDFNLADAQPAARIAEWHGCGALSLCSGDGASVACPCANDGAAGHGCANSSNVSGAVLTAAGVCSLGYDTVRFDASGEMPSALSILLQGDTRITAVSFGQGVRCIGGSLKRLYVGSATNGTYRAPTGRQPRVHGRSASLGDTISAGSSRFYCAYYRDPTVHGGCPAASTFNATQALRLIWSQ